MIQSKADYQKYLKSDRLRITLPHWKRPRPFMDYEWRYLRCLRKLEYLINCKSGIFFKYLTIYYRFKLYRLRLKTGFTVPPNVFKEGLSLLHTGTIIVNGTAKVGKNCVLQCCTNISRYVKIGDNVYIAPGVKILDNVEIADGVIIGANSVVSRSILEPNITVVGAPARKVIK